VAASLSSSRVGLFAPSAPPTKLRCLRGGPILTGEKYDGIEIVAQRASTMVELRADPRTEYVLNAIGWLIFADVVA